MPSYLQILLSLTRSLIYINIQWLTSFRILSNMQYIISLSLSLNGLQCPIYSINKLCIYITLILSMLLSSISFSEIIFKRVVSFHHGNDEWITQSSWLGNNDRDIWLSTKSSIQITFQTHTRSIYSRGRILIILKHKIR